MVISEPGVLIRKLGFTTSSLDGVDGSVLH